MSRPSPYAGYGGPPPSAPPAQRGYGSGPTHHSPRPMMGSTPPYGSNSYGSAQSYAHAQNGSPSTMQQPHGPSGSAYGQENQNIYGGPPPLMGNRPPMPLMDGSTPGGPPMGPGQGPYGGSSSAYGPPIHYDGSVPGAGRPPPHAGTGGNPYSMSSQQQPPPQHQQQFGMNQQSPYAGGPTAGGYNHPYNQGVARASYNDASENGGQQPHKRLRTENKDNGGARDDGNYSEYLQERLNRERPCRTLFVRNIDFTTNVGELRARFESFGQIKTWFDLIKKRGIAFVTYYDLRAAESAREALQGVRVGGGRELDVHFSLPREAEMSKRCDRDKDQGTLFLVLKRAPDDLSDEELMNLLAPFGEIKNLRPYKDQPNCRFVEYWDSRATTAAHDNIINTNYRGGTWDVKFAWDQGVAERLPDMAKHERDRERLNKMGYRPGDGNNDGGAAVNRGPRGGSEGNGGYSSHGGGGGGGGAGMKRPHDYDSGYRGGGGGGPSHEQPVVRRWGQPQLGRPDAAVHGQAGNVGSPYGAGGGAAYGAGSPPVHAGGGAMYGTPPVTSGGQGDANRLEQAQKVQQLLASLKPGGLGGANVSSGAGTPPTPAPTASASGKASSPPAPTAPTAPAAAPVSANGGGQSAPSSLPSNIAALLQMAQSKAAAANQQK